MLLVGRVLLRAHQGEVLRPAGDDQLRDREALGRIADDHEAPRLLPAAARRAQGELQHPVERLVIDGRVGVLPDGAALADRVGEFHPNPLVRVMRAPGSLHDGGQSGGSFDAGAKTPPLKAAG